MHTTALHVCHGFPGQAQHAQAMLCQTLQLCHLSCCRRCSVLKHKPCRAGYRKRMDRIAHKLRAHMPDTPCKQGAWGKFKKSAVKVLTPCKLEQPV